MDDAPHIILNVGGKERRFRFDMNAIADFQGVSGVKLEDFDDLPEIINNNVGVFTALLWAGLYQYDEDIQKREVGQWYQFKDVESLGNKIWPHVKACLGMEKPKNSTRATPKKQVKETTVKKRSGAGSSPSKNRQT